MESYVQRSNSRNLRQQALTEATLHNDPLGIIRKRGAGVGVAGEVLQVDDVSAAFAGRRQRCDAERVHGHSRIELELPRMAAHESFHRPRREVRVQKAVTTLASRRAGWTE